MYILERVWGSPGNWDNKFWRKDYVFYSRASLSHFIEIIVTHSQKRVAAVGMRGPFWLRLRVIERG